MWVGSLAQLMPCSGLSSQVKRLLAEGINRPRKGHDAGDHPPITPMKSATEAELGMGAPLRSLRMREHTHARACTSSFPGGPGEELWLHGTFGRGQAPSAVWAPTGPGCSEGAT